MNRYMDFLMKVSLSLVCLFVIGHAFSKEYKSIKVDELNKLVNQRNIFKGVLIDVRTPYEVKSGILNGAVVKNVYDKDFELFVKSLDRSREYYVYCHSGVRSLAVVSLMEKYKIVGVNVRGGISAWRKSGLPTIGKNKDIIKEIIE